MNTINVVYCVVFSFLDAAVSSRTASDNTRHIPNSILRQKPQVKQMFRLLRDKSANWFEIGLEFDVSLDFRNSLIHHPTYSDRARLEAVLNEWSTTTDQCQVTWQEFIEVMRSLKYADIIAKTKEFLQSR